MPWVTFDLNQFKGRAVTEDEYPSYFHRKDADGVATAVTNESASTRPRASDCDKLVAILGPCIMQ